MTSCFVYSDSFPELVRYLTERTRDGFALRRRRGGGECDGDGEERPMKSAVIAVASRNVQKKRKGDDAWGAIEEVRRLDKEVEEEETEKPPPRLAVKPKSLLGSVENVKPFVESKVPLTAGLHPREPLRDVSAEGRRADNAEDASKKKGRPGSGRRWIRRCEWVRSRRPLEASAEPGVRAGVVGALGCRRGRFSSPLVATSAPGSGSGLKSRVRSGTTTVSSLGKRYRQMQMQMRRGCLGGRGSFEGGRRRGAR